MARIRGKDTAPERILRSALWAAGLRYRIHSKTPFGRPDVVFPSKKIAVFIDGCFWHGCPKHYVRPSSRAEFWARKLRINVDRDRSQTLELEDAGWMVVRVWEHGVFEDLEIVVERIKRCVHGRKDTSEVDWRVVRVEEIDPGNRIERRFLEALRDPTQKAVQEGRRVTAKWRRS